MAKGNTDRKVGKPGKWTVFLVGLGAAATGAAAPGDRAPDSAPVTVINDATRPIPVAGKVTASVSGSVAVSSVPTALTDRIDLALDRLDDISAATGSSEFPRANYARTFRYDLSAQGGAPLILTDPPCLPSPDNPCYEHLILDQTVWASFITISTENDDAFVNFYSDPALCCEASGAVLRFGHNDRQLPSVITATLPQAIPIRSIRFFCRNNTEDCEVAISIIGTADE